MAEQKVFTKGLVIKKPRENAPEFVKAAIAINVTEFTQFLMDHAKLDGWVNIDVLESHDGEKWYGVLNQWTKSVERPRAAQENSSEEITPDSIPF